MDILKYWKDNGTKILGTLVVILGGLLTLGLIPPALTQIVEGLVTFLGGTTVKRGFTNSAATPPSA
jgi:hypothetical protein